jgi:hypothetical protein
MAYKIIGSNAVNGAEFYELLSQEQADYGGR